jgi:hypothetical protein
VKVIVIFLRVAAFRVWLRLGAARTFYYLLRRSFVALDYRLSRSLLKFQSLGFSRVCDYGNF